MRVLLVYGETYAFDTVAAFGGDTYSDDAGAVVRKGGEVEADGYLIGEVERDPAGLFDAARFSAEMRTGIGFFLTGVVCGGKWSREREQRAESREQRAFYQGGF